MRIIVLTAVGLSLTLVAGCVPRPSAPPPAPLPAPQPRPEPAPSPPPPAPAPADWQDAPLAAGDWRFRETGEEAEAAFGAAQPVLRLRCLADRSVVIEAMGLQGAALTVRTTFGERRLPATATTVGAATRLSAGDPLLDQIAFSRGRFMVQSDAGGALIVPSWPEAARIVEDCRA